MALNTLGLNSRNLLPGPSFDLKGRIHDGMVALHLLLLRRLFSQQRDSTLRERGHGSSFSKPLCQATGSGTLFFDRKRALGCPQLRGFLYPDLSGRRVQLTLTTHVAALGLGFLLMGLMGARLFGRFHGGNSPEDSNARSR